MNKIQNILDILYQGYALNQTQTEQLIQNIIQKKLSSVQIASALISMKVRGETFEEIIGTAKTLLTHARTFPNSTELFADITGTGGDRIHTINISTASAIVAATCNVKIIKHGNYGVSGLIGSMDLFHPSNNLEFREYTNQSYQKFKTLGICFLHVYQYYQIFHDIMPIRKQLQTPTLFNIVGPLINPAKPPFALIGVYKKTLLHPVIKALKLLKYHRAVVVHCDGIDEVGLHSTTDVSELHNNAIDNYILTPSDFGLKSYPIEDLYCYSKKKAIEYMEKLLQGKGKPAHISVVAANVALLLKLFGHNNLKNNTALVLDKIYSGIPYTHLQSLLHFHS